MRWKELFAPRILDRGWTYWRLGSVRALEANEDSIAATVEGSEEYAVRIDLRGGKIANLSCTCPYAQDGEHCKHMAAALFAWSEEARPAGSNSDDDALKAIVEGASEAAVRSFLTEVLRRDPRLRARFVRLLKPKRADEALGAARSRVDEIVDRCMEDGFIGYCSAFSFAEELRDALGEETDCLLQLGRPRDAFEFVTHVLCALDGVDMDDSEGELSELMCECQSCIEAILDGANKDDERHIFDQMLRFRGGNFAESAFNALLEERFEDPDYQRRKLQRELRQLARLAKDNPKDSFVQLQLERCALRCLELLEKANAAQSEIESFCGKYWHVPLVRCRRMDELEREGRWEELVEVVKESIALDEQTRPDLLPNYHLRLKNAHLRLGDSEAYRAELWALATRWKPCELACFREYRALFSVDDWPAERERLLAALPRYANPGPLFIEEKLYDRLLDRALAEPGLYWLQMYEEHLAGRYPGRVLQKYAQELNYAARNSSNRSIYRHWAATLRHMRTLPGGEEAVQTLVAEWRERYPRRPAMLDELKEF